MTRLTRIAEALFTTEPMSWDTALRLARVAEVAYTKAPKPSEPSEPSSRKLERLRRQRIAKPITEADWELRAQMLAKTGKP